MQAKPWSETSLLIDVFTREHGRFRLLAKGARRQKTGQSGFLQPFQPLIISWSGKRGLATLTGTEISKPLPRLSRDALASAYYMSELLFKFLHQFDAHEALFDAYDLAIKALAKRTPSAEVLRSFECDLLTEVGYGLQLACNADDGLAVDRDSHYYYHPEKGPVAIEQNPNSSNEVQTAELQVSGETLIALDKRDFQNESTRRQSKALLRHLLTRQIKEPNFRTRNIYVQMLSFKKQLQAQS